MIRISEDLKSEYDRGKIQDLFNEVDKVIEKRQSIQERYLRGITSTTNAEEGKGVQIFFEKFITDLAAGYLSGEIVYNAEIVDALEEPAYRLLHPEHTTPLDPDTAAQLKFIITTLSSKNDDKRELKQLFHDAVLFGCAYERQLSIDTSSVTAKNINAGSSELNTAINNTTNTTSTTTNYTYYNMSALNTVALYPTNIQDISQQNPVGLISVYTLDARNSEDNQEHTLYYCIECNPYTNTYQTTIYDKTTNQEVTDQHMKSLVDKNIITGSANTTSNKITIKKEIPSTHHIPTFSVFEPDPCVSIIDPIISLVNAYENIMNNLNNTYQYNDTDAKLKISGYRPENPLTIPNPDFDPTAPISASNSPSISNPAREIEDAHLQNSKTFFVQEGGDVSWLLKEIHAEDATKYLKYYVDSIFQISGIPNTSDAAFNSGDLNASAIDRKFYTMALMLDDIRQGVVTLIKHRWANFFAKINLINEKYYNIDDITININTNLPSMTDENINQQLALNGIISQKTLLSNLGYDYATEHKNKEEEKADIPYDTMVPDTPYVSPNRVTSTTSSNTSATTSASVNTNTSAKPVKSTLPDRTDNIKPTHTREGRPNI